MIGYEIGCRFFELSYPFDISENGVCLLSDFYPDFEGSEMESNINNDSDVDFASLDLKQINLNQKEFEKDIEVIKENCECFTCKARYTRAYIHHLLKCKELNANILIIMHNLFIVQKIYESFTKIKSDSVRFNYFEIFLRNECEQF